MRYVFSGPATDRLDWIPEGRRKLGQRRRRRAEFPPWAGEVLTVDAVRPLSRNLAAVLAYVTG